MNNEFKKISGKNETRFVLEAGSSGATTAGAVATGPVGRKGNLLVQGKDKKPVVQRRNPVAGNVNATVGGGGAGPHQDKTKIIPRKEKHRKDYRREFEENVEEGTYKFDRKLGRMDRDSSDPDQRHGLFLGGILVKTYSSREEAENVQRRDPRFKSAEIKKIMPEGYGMNGYATVAGSEPISKHVPEAAASNYSKLSDLEALVRTVNKAVHDIKYEQGHIEIVSKIEDLAKQHNIDVRYEVNEVIEAKRNLDSAVYGLVEPFKDAVATEQARIDDEESQGVAEGNVDPGYIDQENSMTSSSLNALYQQAAKLRKLIKRMGDDTTLEPWQQEKIAKAADYVNSVFRSTDDEYNLGRLEEEKQKGVDGKVCWKGYKRMGTKKKGGKTVDNCVKVGEDLDEEQKKGGLWRAMWDRRKKGLPPRKPGEKGAPTKKSWDSAVAASKKKKKAAPKENAEFAESPQFTSRDQVIKHFVSRGKPAAAGAAAWDRGWRGHVEKPASPKAAKPVDASPTQGRLFPESNDQYLNELSLQLAEKLMPASHFAGTPKNKLGPKAHLKGKMKRPARQGDLVGGGAEESYSKKKTLKKN